MMHLRHSQGKLRGPSKADLLQSFVCSGDRCRDRDGVGLRHGREESVVIGHGVDGFVMRLALWFIERSHGRQTKLQRASLDSFGRWLLSSHRGDMLGVVIVVLLMRSGLGSGRRLIFDVNIESISLSIVMMMKETHTFFDVATVVGGTSRARARKTSLSSLFARRRQAVPTAPSLT